uniref:GH10 domain-containing protein n=1 Tax=Fagus sylvatica TaxID=28930 RepID=A0A2N9F114_FAGSY
MVIAEHGCWSLLKGGIVANFSTAVEILFESKNTKVEIWVDNVSLQPFTKKQWKAHQDISIDKVRKSEVRFQVTQANKTAMQGAIVSIKQFKSEFPFGCGMNHIILKSTDYQNWFASRFKFTTFTNEMKWYSTEKKQGQENYTVPDAMVKFAKQNGISIREFYSTAYQLDPNAIMFMNEYNTIEYSEDQTVSAANYKKKLEEILQYPGNDRILAGIGLQGRFGSGQPNLAYMRSSLDILGATGVPIWLTEVNVDKDPDQAQYLEEILREGYSHPAVQGIVMFAGPEIAGFKVMPLADTNFQSTPAGDVVDMLLGEWKCSETLEFTADDKGFVDVLLFHGDYNVTVQHTEANSSTTLGLRVTKDIPQATIDVQIHT